MRTVRIMVALAVVVSIAIPLMAQEKTAAKRKAAKLSPIARSMLRLEKLRNTVEGLDLTADQEAKLEQVREELRPKMADAYDKLQDILTEEQRTAAKEAGSKAKDAGKEGRAVMVAVESALKLTDEQKETTDKVHKEVWRPLIREATREVMGVLTPEQRETVKTKMAPQKGKGKKQGKNKNKQ